VNGGSFNPSDMRWPGDYDNLDTDGLPEEGVGAEGCLTGAGPANFGGQVLNCNVAYMPASALENPWGQPYVLDLIPGPNATPVAGNGGFGVRTNVPESVAGVLRAFVPGGECEAGFNGGTAPSAFCTALTAGRPAGFRTCCSVVPAPGREASFEEMTNQLTPQDGGDCETHNSTCPAGMAARGIICNGKNCADPDIRCCPATVN
ncbi:MAG: hypothetical protein AAFY60_10195, partial [Myxococcota bacterium]